MSLKKFLWIALGAALLLGGCSESPAPSEALKEAMDDTLLEHAQKHADPTYVCPMHPQIVRNEPGNCPICGMALVLQEVEAEEGADAGPPIVTIRPETLQNMGVRTAEVERGTLHKHIETVGYVAYDEYKIVHVHPRAAGWVEKLLVRAEGEPVRRGQPLLEYYSPELVNAQEEYLLALEGAASGVIGRGRDLIQGARRRLMLLEVPQAIIEGLERTRKVRETVPIPAPENGVITYMGLREGMYVKPEMELLAITDVSSVWVQVDVFEHQLDWVREGQGAEIQVAALPGRVWKGEVDYIYPELDPVTRTLKVRLRIPNEDGVLKPNMYARAAIHGKAKPDVLSVPRDALIVTGDQERVIVALEDGRFQPRPVVTGLKVGNRVEILQGLEENERVVVSGQFLIDSESNLQASFRRMDAVDPHAGH